MNSQKAFDLIDDLLDKNSNNYCVDFVPFTFQNEDYGKLEAYLNKHYKTKIAEKIKFIAFAIAYYYESYIYLDEEVADALYPDLKDKNLRNLELEQLAEIIDNMIIGNYSALNILFKIEDQFALLRIEDGFDVYFFNVEGSDCEKVRSLVEHQGLYFKAIILDFYNRNLILT